MSDSSKDAVVERIKAVRAIAVIRTATVDQALDTAHAVIEAGFELVEITYGVPEAARVIARLVDERPDLCFGAGTVLTAEQVDESVNAGAQFLVSPCSLPEMIAAARERDVVCIPGAFTPTEVYIAYSLGADFVKIFPAVANGPEYLRAMRGPLPDIPIIPTSGVTTGNVGDWFRAGAVAVGAVGSVLDPELIRSGNWDALSQRAREFLAAIPKT
ncbi:MAG: bifunctional 4-hydroxy-2-oxoglutarate aldolase/2-dehydro-3-deoxy-phosphogluconate aldolase [Chthoniobacterales bacterium]